MQETSKLQFCTTPFLLEPSWQKVLLEELKKPYIAELASFVKNERLQGKQIYPPEELVFNAFTKTPYNSVRVVIVGQDPYHGKGQAHGLSFSVEKGIKPPPSLKNIFKELHNDLNIAIPNHGSLVKWALQGVLLLNATLTVQESKPLSHHKKGWERFTDAVICSLVKRNEPIIFVLWGKNGYEKCIHVPELTTKHTILHAPHPSPLSAYTGFFGCGHFSKINQILISRGEKPIDWQLD